MAKDEKSKVIIANDREIGIRRGAHNEDYFSLTDIARYRADEPAGTIANWLRNRETIKFLGLWERIYNPDFKLLVFEEFINESGSKNFALSPKRWIEATGAIGIESRSGRFGGGTYGHVDIAMEFASYVSPEFKMYIITDYKRLRGDESSRMSLSWHPTMDLALLTGKAEALPEPLTSQLETAYDNEADVVNVALYGMTNKQWKAAHPEHAGDIRSNGKLSQLIVYQYLEMRNQELIRGGMPQKERLILLNKLAIEQMQYLIRESSAARIDNEVPMPPLLTERGSEPADSDGAQ